MPFFQDLPDPLENVAPRTSEGAKGVRFPVTGLDEKRIAIPGCNTCSKKELHGPPCKGIGVSIPHGETRHDRVPAENKIPASSLQALCSALWWADFIANGVPHDLISNVGFGADNISNQMTYEVVSVSGSAVTVKGRNPKFLGLGISRLNPDYPLPDEATGQPGRIVFLGLEVSLPVGCLVVFAWPSVLHDKLTPAVVRIDPPESDDLEDVTFTLTLSHPVTCAQVPYDARFPPMDGKYYLELFFFATYPQKWPNWQTGFESQFTSKTLRVPVATIISLSALIPLTDTASASTRVIYPDMMTGGMQITYRRTSTGSVVWDPPELRELITTTQVAEGSFTTTLDVADLMDFEDLEYVEIIYRPEALVGDSFRMPYSSSCANSQLDWSGSYGGRRCINQDCSQFATYQSECWQPDADGFRLGTEQGYYRDQEPALGISSPFVSANLSRLWNRAYWIYIQSNAGDSATRNTALSLPGNGGPSVGNLLGHFANNAPVGLIPTRRPLLGPAYGIRTVSTDEAGNQTQALAFGAYVRAAEQDLNMPPVQGSLISAMGDWATAKETSLGSAAPLRLALYPSHHPMSVHLYDYTEQGDGMMVTCRRGAGEQVFLTNMSLLDPEDAAVTAAIRTRFS